MAKLKTFITSKRKEKLDSCTQYACFIIEIIFLSRDSRNNASMMVRWFGDETLHKRRLLISLIDYVQSTLPCSSKFMFVFAFTHENWVIVQVNGLKLNFLMKKWELNFLQQEKIKHLEILKNCMLKNYLIFFKF
jgi:hypothetical protein